jgi:predicted HD phosphohydrolase
MGHYGAVKHEVIGAEYLRSLGMPELVCTLVARHVDAKRYLTYAQPSYLAKLSDASKATLAYQGGPMSAAEAALFDQDPYKKTILLMRTWDEKAKVADWRGPGFDAYIATIDKLCTVEAPRLTSVALSGFPTVEQQSSLGN